MNPFILKIAFLVFTIIMWIIRMPYHKANKAALKTKQQIDITEKIVLFIATIGMMIVPNVYSLYLYAVIGDYHLPIAWQIVGLILLYISLYIFYLSHRDLGNNWSASLEIREKHTLIRKGIYNKIRHPMYSAIWLWCVAQPLVLNNWIAGFSSLIAFAILYFSRIDREEEMMVQEFGKDYIAYKNTTKRLIPYVI